jgi:hypothetical protein
MHICILCISKFKHIYCRHCACYWYYCLSPVTALPLSVLWWTLWAEPPSNNHSNSKQHQSKNFVVILKLWQMWKKLFTFSAPNYVHNNVLKFCTRDLNHPVYYICICVHATQITDNTHDSCGVLCTSSVFLIIFSHVGFKEMVKVAVNWKWEPSGL